MLLKELIEILKSSPDTALNFVIEMQTAEQKIPAHMHITEIKQYAIQSVDCGGKAHNWSETVMQIWAKNPTDDGHRVTTGKALEIINAVDKVITLDKSNALFIEYKNDAGLVSQYQIAAQPAKAKQAAVTLKLLASNTQCKAPGQGLMTADLVAANTAADATSSAHTKRCHSHATSSCC